MEQKYRQSSRAMTDRMGEFRQSKARDEINQSRENVLNQSRENLLNRERVYTIK